jgi:hypothetical protein
VRLLSELCRQADGKPVEVLGLLDNKRRTLGAKRNALVSMARGDYVAFVGDDDSVTNDYVDALLDGITKGADVVTFWMSLEEFEPVVYRFLLPAFPVVDGGPREHWGTPMDICVWKREIATQVRFPEVSAGEDGAWSEACAKLATTQYEIGKTLYFRKVDRLKSETSRNSPCARDTLWKEPSLRRKDWSR